MSSLESVILGTDMASPLELNTGATGPLVLDELSFPPAKKKPRFADGREGGVLVDEAMAYDNGEVTAKVGVLQQSTMDLAVAKIGLLQDMLQEAERRGDTGLPCSWTPADSTTTWTWYLLLGEVTDLPVTIDALWFSRAPTLTVGMTRRPFLYRPEVTGPTVTSSLPVVELTVPSIAGDVSAEARLVITDPPAGVATRRFVEWGLEQRWLAEGTAANGGTAPPLIIESDSLVTSGFAGSTGTRTGAYDPNAAGPSVVLMTTLGQTTAVCGTGDQKHIGTYRVRARVDCAASTIRLRLAWQDGDGPFRANPYVAAPVAPAWVDVDLGLITVEQAVSGTQRWSGRIEAYDPDPAGGHNIYIDYLRLVPAGEGYGKARAVQQFVTPTTITAIDGFDQAAGNLATKALVVGGTWTGAGDADDLAVEATGHTAERVSVSDADINTGRYALAGTTAFTDVMVQADYKRGGVQGAHVSQYIHGGVFARYVDTSNWLKAVFEADLTNLAPTRSIKLIKRVAGTVTELGSYSLGSNNLLFAPSTWYTIRVLVDAAGRASVWWGPVGSVGTSPVISVTDSVLATAGALASGKAGMYDGYTYSFAVTRNFDNFLAAVPPAEPVVLYSGRTLQVRSDTVVRDNSAGTILGEPASYRGSHFYVPSQGGAARSSRVAVSARRYDVETANDDGITDSTKVQVFTTSRYLTPR